MVNEIIPKFKAEDQPALKDAAAHFRLPYWDWAQKKKRIVGDHEDLVYDVPLIVKGTTVKVPNPNGGMDDIPNPLNSFIAQSSMGEYGITSLQLSDDDDKEPYVAAPVSFVGMSIVPC
jgi:tyrosinase